MRYRIAISLIGIVFLIALYDHLITGWLSFDSGNYILGLYNWSVCVLLFLFAGGYVSRVENGLTRHKEDRMEEERLKAVKRAEESVRLLSGRE